ncbi:hypothetical protein GQ457_07G010760 [Hibiscus cannabinus]
MQDPENTSGKPLTLRHLDEFGGRPPDGISEIPPVISLEHPSSPTLLEGQSVMKKVRSSVDVEEISDGVDMDAEKSDGHMREDVVHTPFLPSENVQRMVSQEGDGALYASKVLEGQNRASASKLSGFIEQEITIAAEDLKIDISDPIPSIRFSDRVHDQVDHNMRNSLIVRLLGRSIGFKALQFRILVLWKHVGDIKVIDLDNNYYIIWFSAESDYVKVLTQGPWTIYGSYLTVQPWSRQFSTLEEYPSKVIVWVRLPGMPYRYYSKALFRHIATLIGEVFRVDYNTTEGGRGIVAVGQQSGSRYGVLSNDDLQGDIDTGIGEGIRGESVMPATKKDIGDKRARVDKSRKEGHVGDVTMDLEGTRGKGIRNAAYLASNPYKRKKKMNAKSLESVEVVATMNGSKSTLVDHHPVVRTGSHTAVRIVEDINHEATPSRKDGVARQGIRIKKALNSGRGGLGVVEWVKSAHARIDAMGKHPIGKPDGTSHSTDNLVTDHFISEEESWEEDTTANMSDVGEETDVGVGHDPSEGIITDSYSTRGQFPHVNCVVLAHLDDPVSDIEEILHSMKRKKGAVGWMAIKIDLEKAYDRLEWGFIQDTLFDLGLPSKLCKLIMHCISTVSLQILWNGSVTDSFSPSRGIRQGDPLSPYIFVLFLERLVQTVAEAVSLG